MAVLAQVWGKADLGWAVAGFTASFNGERPVMTFKIIKCETTQLAELIALQNFLNVCHSPTKINLGCSKFLSDGVVKFSSHKPPHPATKHLRVWQLTAPNFKKHEIELTNYQSDAFIELAESLYAKARGQWKKY